MFRAALVLVVVASCADDAPPPPDPWDAAVAAYVDAACTSACVSGSEAQCRTDVGAELARALMLLDDTGQTKCEACLGVKTSELGEIAACMPTAEQTAAVDAACDLDPTVDYDGDGDPTDDFSEACAGEP